MALNESLQVTDEFIAQNLEYSEIKKSHKKGGPYSKNERNKIRNEVYRLHFEYGYSARKIAEMMNVNRNTINGDIDYWYSKTTKNVDTLNLESEILTMLERMNVQRTRLREQLDKTKNHSERMSIERLIYDIDAKILHTYQKLSYSTQNVIRLATMWYDNFMKQNGSSKRAVSRYELLAVSPKASERIQKIIEEDNLHKNLNKKF